MNDPQAAPRNNQPAKIDEPTGGKQKAGQHKLLDFFDCFASRVTSWTGSPATFILAFLLVVIWGVTGPMFDFSETWQLVINTGTTIITFLMVFLIQQSQNKDSEAVHVKLDALLAAAKNARDDVIDSEHLSEGDLDDLAKQYRKANGK